MLFNSFQFLIFFPAAALIYFIVPQKIKNVWLLIMSYYFYMSWNAKYALLLLFSTVVTYASGLLLAYFSAKNSPHNFDTRSGALPFCNISQKHHFLHTSFR